MKPLKFKKCNLKNLTWLKSGGEAQLFQPESIEDLSKFIKSNKKFFTIGAGSNVLAGDKIDKTIIRLGRKFNYVEYRENPIRVVAGAATSCKEMAKYALGQGITGFEFLSVIPGSVGGAIAMNAGAYGNDISKIMRRATVIDQYGELAELSNYEMGFKYRGSVIPKEWVIIEAGFTVKKDDPEIIKEKMAKMLKEKTESQPARCKTCGSIFKNPPGKYAWELIDKAGFRGFKLGDAEISKKHCNFLINHGNATSDDLMNICHMVRNGVEEKFAIKLEFELVLL